MRKTIQEGSVLDRMLFSGFGKRFLHRPLPKPAGPTGPFPIWFIDGRKNYYSCATIPLFLNTVWGKMARP